MIRIDTAILLFAVIVNGALGVFILSRRSKRVVNRVFSAFIISIAGWTASLLLLTLRADVVFGKLAFAFASVIPSQFLHFSLIFPVDPKSSRKIVVPSYILSGLFIILAFSPLLSPEVRHEEGYISGNLGVAFPYFLIFFLGVTSIGLINFVVRYRKAKGVHRLQIRYIFLGILLFALLAASTNLILPTIGVYNFNFFGPSFSIIFVGFVSYTIVRHRLLDIRIVITRSIIFGALVTLVALAFILITFFSAEFFGDTPTSRNVIAFVVAVVIVAGLDPLKRLLSRLTDRVFFKASIDYAELLRKLTEVLSVEIELEPLVSKFSLMLEKELKVKSVRIAIQRTKGNGGSYSFVVGGGRRALRAIEANHAIVRYLRASGHTSMRESLERKIEDLPETAARRSLEQSLRLYEATGAAVIAPITAQNQLNGLLVLGPKRSGEAFSSADLDLLEVLGPQLGSAIQKANLYEEVRAFGARLQRKVDEATAELKDRNVSLVTLQSITKSITRTLDFRKVVQSIADAVAKQLGYVGAVLVFIDDDGHTVRARAITNTPLTAKALRMLPKHFSEFSTDLADPSQTNLAHEVIKSGQIRFTEDFAEVISPPLPKALVRGIQRLIGVKTIAVVPVIAEEKVIGVIEIGSKKPEEQITEREVGTMQSIADQLGVVSRNLRLFEQLKQANAELEDANKHLQQLDQAKSEFVSIASHQLRTPMTGIMGYLSMMTSGDFGPIKPEHARILKSLLLESQRMIRLINLFLNVSKIEAGKFEMSPAPIDLIPLIEKQLKEVEKLARDKKLSLEFERPKKPLPKVMADQDKIQDVILNLLDNAIKYTKEGSVRVRTEVGPGELVVSIQDTGVGIPKDQVPELFNKFVRGSGIARIHPDGSGLGLFIAKRIVEGHRGRIWVESEGEGKGSTFSFALPLS